MVKYESVTKNYKYEGEKIQIFLGHNIVFWKENQAVEIQKNETIMVTFRNTLLKFETATNNFSV